MKTIAVINLKGGVREDNDGSRHGNAAGDEVYQKMYC